MKRKNIIIGENSFASKKQAAEFYRNILKKYQPKESLNDEDFSSLIDLYNYTIPNDAESEDSDNPSAEIENTEIIEVDDICVDYHPAYRSTKCFYFVYGDEKALFSFLLAINGGLSNDRLFYISCRNSVKTILHNFKREIFEKKPVKCALSNIEVTWENCHIDHKAPMTFSIIVKTFQKSHKIDVDTIEFSYDSSVWRFGSKEFEAKFVEYHNSLALLRIISAEENMKLAAKARTKPSKKRSCIK